MSKSNTQLNTTVLIVTSIGDADDNNIGDGICSTNGQGCTLRAAIQEYNASGVGSICFNIPGAGAHTISPLAPLPPLNFLTFIDGTTQPGYAGIPLIELDGSLAGLGSNGFTILGGANTIRALAINRFEGDGVFISGLEGGNNNITENHIGTDRTATVVDPDGIPGNGDEFSNNGNGVRILNSHSNFITNNVISGNEIHGIHVIGLLAVNNFMLGNKIGTDITGTVDLGNAVDGIRIEDAPDNTVGWTNTDGSNLISGNDNNGINVIGTGSTDNTIIGNKIGVSQAGLAALPNTQNGIAISGASLITIGGAAVAGVPPGNQISGNGANGILASGTSATLISIKGNLIGTNMGGTGVVPNGEDGIHLSNAPGNLVGGGGTNEGNTISGNTGDGVEINGKDASGNQIFGNLIGTDVLGTTGLGIQDNGIYVNNAPGNQIGNSTTAGSSPGNVVSANTGHGLKISGADATGNFVQQNIIGLDKFGAASLGNVLNGILIDGASGNTIGGIVAGPLFVSLNIISANVRHGVEILGKEAMDNLIQANYIGTDITGTVNLGNILNGVLVNGAPKNTIGGLDVLARNIISGNFQSGIELFGADASGNIVAINYIGVDVSGMFALGNALDGILIWEAKNNKIGDPQGINVIGGNGGNGIQLFGIGATQNIIRNNLMGRINAIGPLPPLGAANLVDGVLFDNAPNNTLGGTGVNEGNIITNNIGNGLQIRGNNATGNKVEGNNIGIYPDGTIGGNGLNGVLVNDAPANTIGGSDVNARNIISGNVGDGVQLRLAGANANRIQKNYIGVTPTGTAAAPNTANGLGMYAGAHDNIVGGLLLTGGSGGNVISGNGRNGVLLSDAGTNANRIQSNNIGTDPTGTTAIPNGGVAIAPTGMGVAIVLEAQSNIIGGSVAGEGNLISGNLLHNVFIDGTLTDDNRIQDNLVGPNISRSASLSQPTTLDGIQINGGPRFNEVKDNTVEGHPRDGIAVLGANFNEVLQNFVGSANLPNARHGIQVGPVILVPVPGGPIFPIAGANDNLVSNNNIANSGNDGILITGTTNENGEAPSRRNLVTSNTVLGNQNNGIRLLNDVSLTVIGGFFPLARNVISGNFDAGIHLLSTLANNIPDSNTIAGNYIGTDISGTLASPNGFPLEADPGILVSGADNEIGPDNLISANSGAGIELNGAVSTGNRIIGNIVGLQADAVSPLGNSGDGILVTMGAANNQIGVKDTMNIIQFNGGAGVMVAPLAGIGNNIDPPGSIAFNDGLGIDLNADGVSVNDAGDPDVGPNNLQNYPDLTSAETIGGPVLIQGALMSSPNTLFRIEFYSNTECDPSGFGEGESYLGAIMANTDNVGTADFSFNTSNSLPEGSFITSTATTPDGSTSEFSKCILLDNLCPDTLEHSNTMLPSGTYQAKVILSTTIVESGDTVIYQAETKIVLKPGFWVQPGSELLAMIDGCLPPSSLQTAEPIPERSVTSFSEIVQTSPIEKSSLKVYPNPNSGFLQIQYYVPVEQQVEITIHSINGRLEERVTRDFSFAGGHQISHDMSNLKPGVYICSMQTQAGKLSVKIIKL